MILYAIIYFYSYAKCCNMTRRPKIANVLLSKTMHFFRETHQCPSYIFRNLQMEVGRAADFVFRLIVGGRYVSQITN